MKIGCPEKITIRISVPAWTRAGYEAPGTRLTVVMKRCGVGAVLMTSSIPTMAGGTFALKGYSQRPMSSGQDPAEKQDVREGRSVTSDR